jgi:GNAT superfamily N-acetyltransferase
MIPLKNKNLMKRIVVFFLEPCKITVNLNYTENIQVIKWVPSFFRISPPGSDLKYILFWFAHYLKIFKNRSYSSFQIVKEGQIISSLVCTPPLPIWPFMKKNDIQIKDVYTHPSYRGKGFAFDLINYVIKSCYSDDRTFWYMTHDKNYSSVSLCKKIGFVFKGNYRRNKRFLLIFKIGDILEA